MERWNVKLSWASPTFLPVRQPMMYEEDTWSLEKSSRSFEIAFKILLRKTWKLVSWEFRRKNWICVPKFQSFYGTVKIELKMNACKHEIMRCVSSLTDLCIITRNELILQIIDELSVEVLKVIKWLLTETCFKSFRSVLLKGKKYSTENM